MKWVNTYDIFQGEELEIAELIQQRRIQILIHSCIYYELDYNVISDMQWDAWAKELRDLQNKYPYISKQVMWAEAFEGWDASTGAFLPLKDEWVMRKALKIVGRPREKDKKRIKEEAQPVVQSKKEVKTKMGKTTSSNASSTNKKYPAIAKPTLRKGDRGNEVKNLQSDLNYVMGIKLATDGIFGVGTENALKNFQKKYKLTIDGIYGKASATKIQSLIKK